MGRLLAALLVLAAAAPARSETQVEFAVHALQGDPSLKVRTQAALVLGQRRAVEAVPALREAAARDEAAPVRIAAVSALAQIGHPSGRAAVEAAARDPDPAVREAAARALAAWPGAAPAEPAARSTGLAFSIEEPAGDAGGPQARRALREALERHLRSHGNAVVTDGGAYVLKPSVMRVDVRAEGGATLVAVRASLVAVDGRGRMAEMLESGARLRVSGEVPRAAVAGYAARALDAAAKTLCDDLAARLR